MTMRKGACEQFPHSGSSNRELHRCLRIKKLGNVICWKFIKSDLTGFGNPCTMRPSSFRRSLPRHLPLLLASSPAA